MNLLEMARLVAGAGGDCWFCGKPVAGPDSWKVVPMHREIYRVPTTSGEQVSYETTTVVIPRRPECQVADQRLDTVIGIEFWGAAALTAVAWLVYLLPGFKEDPSAGNIIARIFGFAIAVGFTWIVPFAAAAIPTWVALYWQRRRAAITSGWPPAPGPSLQGCRRCVRGRSTGEQSRR